MAKRPKKHTMYDDYEQLIVMNGFDDCRIGIVEQFGRPPIVCYSKSKVIKELMKRSDMDEREAEEFWEYNQVGAYVGEATPCFLITEEDYKAGRS